MANYEHATAIGMWFFKALVESSKLRQMTFSEEAAHHNKPNSRVQNESRMTAGSPVNYATFDQSHVLILQGVHAIADEAPAATDTIHAYVSYPQGPGLAPFLRRPVPVPGGFRGILNTFPGSPTVANLSFRGITDFDQLSDHHASQSDLSMPETAVGYQGIDPVTDYRTSLVITHRWSSNDTTFGTGDVHRGGYLFWRVMGHVAVY